MSPSPTPVDPGDDDESAHESDQQGYFDLAMPYRSVEYVIDHLDVAPDLRANVSINTTTPGT